jgi:hypothetical protein
MSPRKSRDVDTFDTFDTDALPVEPEEQPKITGMNLQAGEQVVVVGRPGMATSWYKYLLTLGLYRIWHKRDLSVLTDRRVFTGRGVVTREEHSTPLKTIEFCSYYRRGLSGYCDITARVGSRDRRQRVGPLAPRTARRFARKLDERT